MRNRRLRATVVLGFALGLTICCGCGGDGASFVPSGPAPEGSWTVMVYMAADNNLGEDALRDLNEMELVGSGENLNIVAQIDLPAAGGHPWTTARRYLVERDTDTEHVGSTLLADLGELDMTRPENLTDFLTWARSAYPADHTLAILWGHGEAWDDEAAASEETPASSRIQAIFNDESSDPDVFMRNHQLGGALAAAGGAFDVLAIDACVMQILEVAYELRGSASILVASQEVVWEDGYPYDAFLAPLSAAPGTTPESLARSMVRAFGTYYDNLVPVRREQCLSAVRLSAAASVALAVDGVAGDLIALLPDPVTVVGLKALRLAAEDFTLFHSRYVDLNSLTGGILDLLGVDTAPLAAAVQAAVIETYCGPDHPAASGLSIYYPLDRAHYELDDSYADHDPATGQGTPCAFVNEYRWDEFLAELYGG